MKRRAITASLVVAVAMLLGKWIAYVITGSSAIFSDAAESVVHIAATVIAAMSLWYADQPPDKSHPYGHGRIAYFSAGFEGALILSASLAILYTATLALIEGPQLKELHLGLWITAGLGAINLALGLYLVRIGKKTGSFVLESNGYHVLTDMWTSAGVVGGVALVHFTGVTWIDPLVAIALGLQIAYTAWQLMRRSYSGLMDSVEEHTTERLIEHFQKAVDAGDISAFHQLRHRRVENALWVEVHMLLPGGLALAEAHARVTQVERQLRETLPDSSLHITTHLEPEEHDKAHPDGHAAEDPYDGS